MNQSDDAPTPVNTATEWNREETAVQRERQSPYQYDLDVDATNADKATTLKFLSLRRPHMRAFYVALISMFVGIYLWFAVSPLQISIRDTLTPAVTDDGLFAASICSVAGSLLGRLVLGAVCDHRGARVPMATLLFLASISTGLTSLIQNNAQLAVCRFLSGFAGSSLVVAQFWIASMFGRNIIGTATGIVLGIGYSGGGFALLFLGGVLQPSLERALTAEQAWRTALAVPALTGLFAVLAVLWLADDTPKGQYIKSSGGERQNGKNTPVERAHDFVVAPTFRKAVSNRSTWILAFQYGLSAGTNAAMINAMPIYFSDVLGASTSMASSITSAVGWLSVTCFVGGFLSDKLMDRAGIRGRCAVQLSTLAAEGVFILIFAHISDVEVAAFLLATFSMFATWATGSTFALVPYVEKTAVGAVAGIIGAGGSFGTIVILYLYIPLDYYVVFVAMGCLVLLSSFMSIFLRFKETNDYLEDNDAKKDTDIEEQAGETGIPAAPATV